MNAAVSDGIQVQRVPFADGFFEISGGHEAATPESLFLPAFLELDARAVRAVALAPGFECDLFYRRVTDRNDFSVYDRVINAPEFAHVVAGDVELETARPWVNG